LETTTVRLARAEDFEAVSALLSELGRPGVTPDNQVKLQAVYDRHLRRSDTASLVAEAGGRIVGFMSLEFRERLNRESPEAWVPDLIVTEDVRATGAGKALLQRGMDLARERGCWALTLESGYSRERAHRFYRLQGMTDEGLFFRYKLV